MFTELILLFLLIGNVHYHQYDSTDYYKGYAGLMTYLHHYLPALAQHHAYI